ncbi:MAG: SDR family NAD(P)-dependent oxidoreductase, partial [Oscillospiraceae bacterium]
MKGTAIVTGGGGVLCAEFSCALGAEGYEVAVLDLNLEAAQRTVRNITAAGGTAKAYQANVLDKENLEAVRQEIRKDFGKCRILINGAGGNNPKCTTAHEEYEKGDESRGDILTFFNLPKENFEFVFDLNLMGTLLPTQIFARDMLGETGCSVLNISSMNAFTPLTKIPAYSAAKVRLRPILMTVLSMVFGLVPLMMAHGVGANGSRSLATGVIGGMIVGTLALLFLVPSLFIVFQYIQER